MALKIIKSSEPIRVDRLNVVIYGQPGCGKSSLAFTSDAPLMLDFDNGAYRAANRKDIVRVERWADIADLSDADLADYKTIIVDTAGRALDALSADIIKRNPKAGRNGALTLQGFGTLKVEFTAWLKHVNQMGKDVVLIAHMDEQRNGDEVIERLDVQGGSKGEIYKSADAMGRIMIREGKRWLNFSPTDAAFGKNPGQLEPLEIPIPSADGLFLDRVVDRIKCRLNELSVEQVAAQKEFDEWQERINGLSSAADFNEALLDVKKAAKAIQKRFAEAASINDLSFDKESSQYVKKVAA